MVVLLQFGFPVTEHGPVWGVVYMPLWAAMVLVGVLVARSEQQPIWPYVVLGAVFSVSGIGVYLLLGGLFTALNGVVVTLDGDALVDTMRPGGPVAGRQLL